MSNSEIYKSETDHTMTDIPKNELYVYDLPDKLFSTLELVRFNFSVQDQLEGKQDTPEPKPKAKEQEDDLTKYNRKREARGLPKLSEEQFDQLLENSSMESISGSESESDDKDESLYKRFNETHLEDSHTPNGASNGASNSHLNTRTPYIYLKSNVLRENKHFGIYKSFFKELELENPITAIDSWRKTQSHGKSALFMIGGGHFAGAIVSHARRNIKGDATNHKVSIQDQQVEILKSKTFHRYTTRRKQGGSQGANDNAKGKANSVGSNIRRYNEQALISDVRELLKTWETDLNGCQSIFIRANGSTGRKTLVGYEGAVLTNGDDRIKSFPFTTKRATTSELKRAWTQLSYLTIQTSLKEDEKLKQKLIQQQESLKKSQQQHKPQQKQLTEDEKHTIELTGFMKKSKAPLLINYMKKNKLNVNDSLSPADQYSQTPTLLHYAASHGLAHIVQVLLVNMKADPTVTNNAGRVPAELSLNASTKQSFQVSRYKLGEDYCDWAQAKVGEGRSKEHFEKDEQLEQEKVKAEKQKQLQEELARKTEMELKKPTFSNKGTVGGSGSLISDTTGLSEQQKTMVMREQRARAAEARLKRMGK